MCERERERRATSTISEFVDYPKTRERVKRERKRERERDDRVSEKMVGERIGIERRVIEHELPSSSSRWHAGDGGQLHSVLPLVVVGDLGLQHTTIHDVGGLRWRWEA